ncbi:MAG TPA: UDP-glucose 4-epimerase GalE, partial [Jiangellaceae bacterium]|nr:UDP-glucose 4-epimerase GalE [Jiangellaceae bacterium]
AHLVRALRAAAVDVVVLDDLTSGVAARLPQDVLLEHGSVLDADVLDRVFADHAVTGVVHLAAKKRVDESVARPSYYYHENVEGLRLLLDRAVAAATRYFLFSSSAAVYGAAASPIDEHTPCLPMSPYGQTKLAGEWLTHAVGTAAGMHTLALRYFNVAGTAAPELADRHGMNLVPMMLRAIEGGEPPVIFGDDYPTPDGTCVRDYIHVVDVANAHVAAVRLLEQETLAEPESVNIGTGRGVSVREMVVAALEVTGSDLEPVIGPRRPGDPPTVVAAVDRAADVLNWQAGHGVTDMVESAWTAMRPSSH